MKGIQIMNREIFKSKRNILLFSILLNLIVLLFEKWVFHDVHMLLSFCILPILSLFLGPVGVLGFTIVAVVDWIISFNAGGTSLPLLRVVMLFILWCLPWKLWYSFMNKNGFETPNMNNLYNFIKILLIVAFVFILSWLLVFLGVDVITEFDVEYGYSISVLSILFLMLAMELLGRYKIQVFTPTKQFKKIMPCRLYDVLLVCSFLFSCVNNDILCLIAIIFMIVYLFKPYNNDVFKVDGMVRNIFYKLLGSLVLLFLLICVVFSIVYVSVDISTMLEGSFDFSRFTQGLTIHVFGVFTVLLIPLLIYFYFLEKEVFGPVNRLSHYLTFDISYFESLKLLNLKLKSIKVNNELKILSNALVDMENELIQYGQDLVDLISEKESYEAELNLSHNIQSSMVPKDFKEFSENRNFNIWGLMDAAEDVGGDFYDYFKIDEDNIGFVIGDVNGKGVSAALIMVKAMTLIQNYGKHYDDPSKVFFRVNNLLCEDNEPSVSSWIGKLNTKTGELSYVNAGHTSPLILNNGNFEYLDLESDLALSEMEDATYKTHKIILKEKDVLFLYNDGVIDAKNNQDAFYGENRLKDALNKNKHKGVDELIDCLEKDIGNFCGNNEKSDDITMFVLKMD